MNAIFGGVINFFFLFQALQEISVEDRKRQLEHSQSEIQRVDTRIEEVGSQYKDVEKKVSEHQKKEKVRMQASYWYIQLLVYECI